MGVKLDLDDPPIREKIKKAAMQLKVGKSPGIDAIPAEVYQHWGEEMLDNLQDLFTNYWEKGTPQFHSALNCRKNLGSPLAE